MSALNHVRNTRAARENFEPYVNSLFRLTFIPPEGVSGTEILTEQVLSVSGWKEPGPEAIQQQYLSAKRNYAGTEVDNTQNITIVFNLNLNNQYQNYTYKTIKSWRKKVFDPLTGAQGLKKDYVGKIVIENFARDGQIVWSRTLHACWPSANIEDFSEDFSASDPVQLNTTWIADWYSEEEA